MTADQKLKALFADDLPPARDIVFQELVLQALDRRIFWQEISILAAACGSGVALLWFALPSIEPLAIGLGRLVTPGLTMLVLGVLLLSQDLLKSRTT